MQAQRSRGAVREWRGARGLQSAQGRNRPKLGAGQEGSRDLRPPPLPPNENQRPARLGPAAGGARCSGHRARAGVCPRGPSAPALPPPRQLAAELGSPSPGSRPSSAPARPAAGPLPICRRAQGESARSRREAPAGLARGRGKFLLRRVARGCADWASGLGGCGRLTFPLRSLTPSPTRDTGSSLETRGEGTAARGPASEALSSRGRRLGPGGRGAGPRTRPPPPSDHRPHHDPAGRVQRPETRFGSARSAGPRGR